MKELNIDELSKQIEDLKIVISRELDPVIIKVPNPKKRNKGELQEITLLKLNEWVNSKFDYGEVTDDNVVRHLLFALERIDNHYIIQIKRLEDFWRRIAQRFLLMKNRIENLEDEVSKLEKENNIFKDKEEEKNKLIEKLENQKEILISFGDRIVKELSIVFDDAKKEVERMKSNLIKRMKDEGLIKEEEKDEGEEEEEIEIKKKEIRKSP